jgi:hypothetical protein
MIDGQAPKFNVALSIRDALHEVRLVRGCLDGQIDRLDRLDRELVAMLGSTSLVAGERLIGNWGQVAHHLMFRTMGDGSAEVAIDGGKRFDLAPQLAGVLQFLASGEGDPDGKDPLVGWRSRSEILAFLTDSAGRKFHRRYVNNLVHRLKRALREAKYDGGLIQTHRQKGVRFAFKKGAQGVPDSTQGGW